MTVPSESGNEWLLGGDLEGLYTTIKFLAWLGNLAAAEGVNARIDFFLSCCQKGALAGHFAAAIALVGGKIRAAEKGTEFDGAFTSIEAVGLQ